MSAPNFDLVVRRERAGRPAALDVLVPTHNRGPQLERAVRSIFAARAPQGFDVRVTVICNGCTDDSASRMAGLQNEFGDRLVVLKDRRRGKSRALNLGLAATSAALVGMIDDDEEVGAEWVQVAAAAFQDSRVDFIGGPYVPCWDTPPPAWVPSQYLAVLGSADNGAVPRAYGRHFPGILKGGNAVVRRSVLERVGPYAEHLGPGGFSRLFSCEDEEMYLRLLELGARGRYLPDLLIYHHVSTARLTPRYYRRWCFWRGVSRGLMDLRHPLPVAYLGGVPRFLCGSAWRGAVHLIRGVVHRQSPEARLAEELPLWDLAGYAVGRHVFPLARFSPFHSRRAGDRTSPQTSVSRLPGEDSHVDAFDDVAINA